MSMIGKHFKTLLKANTKKCLSTVKSNIKNVAIIILSAMQ